MDTTVGGLAKHLKQLIPKQIPENYDIQPMFLDIAREEEIYDGVLNFRNFLERMYDYIIADETLCNVAKKGKKKYSDETTLTVEFPSINNIKSILLNIGQYGVLSSTGDSLLLDSWERLSLKRSYNKNSTSKISDAQMIKGIRLLNQCGVNFSGIDLSVKRPDVNKITSIEITYPDYPQMSVGWKVFGIAQNELATRKNDDILLRCDYQALSRQERDVTTVLKGFVSPLTEPLQNLVIDYHKHYLDLGMTCNVELGSLCTHFMYFYKKKMIWRFSTSLHNGYRMVIKTKNTHKYGEVIDTFPKVLRDRINKGYGCDRKSGSSHGNCQNGCAGFRFPLDDSLLDYQEEYKLWLDSEISSMQKKSSSYK